MGVLGDQVLPAQEKQETLVWVVDTGSSFNGMIYSKLFLYEDQQNAQRYFDSLPKSWYRKIYAARDIWHFTESTIEKELNRLKEVEENAFYEYTRSNHDPVLRAKHRQARQDLVDYFQRVKCHKTEDE